LATALFSRLMLLFVVELVPNLGAVQMLVVWLLFIVVMVISPPKFTVA
jgi:hypothetical protein